MQFYGTAYLYYIPMEFFLFCCSYSVSLERICFPPPAFGTAIQFHFTMEFSKVIFNKVVVGASFFLILIFFKHITKIQRINSPNGNVINRKDQIFFLLFWLQTILQNTINLENTNDREQTRTTINR